MNNTILLAKDGRTDWTIVTPLQASESVQYAAEELTHFLKEISSASFPVGTENGVKNIFVGFPYTEELEEEELVITASENALVLTGGGKRGTLYAVYEFLDTVLGCRWFMPEVSRIPHRDVLMIPSLDIRKKPLLSYREDYNRCAFEPTWAARNRLNGPVHRLTEKHGGTSRYNRLSGGAHSFNLLVPVEEYFDTHPEYFSEVNGVRIKERTQLCLTNPDVVEISKKRVLQWIREDPEADLIAVAQNDCYNPCTCPKCRAIDEREGSYAGTLITFVNQIAEAVAAQYPDKRLGVLAYQYTRKPPKHVKPHPNVIIRLCSIECCFSHPLRECREIASFKKRTAAGSSFVEDFQGWAKITDSIHIWDYTVNFMHFLMPFPNFQVLKENINFFIENHAIGIFEQGNGDTLHGEMEDLRAYVIARLLWNPALDTDAIMLEFLTAYYGQAAAPIKRYLDLLRDKVVSEHIHMGIYDPPTTAYLAGDILDQADALFDEAERLADDDTILKRVQISRMSLIYTHLALLPKNAPDRARQVDAFFQKVDQYGIRFVREDVPNETMYQLFMECPEDLHYHQ